MTPRQWTCVRSQYVYLPTVYQMFYLIIAVIIKYMRVVFVFLTVTWRTWVGFVPAIRNLCNAERSAI